MVYRRRRYRGRRKFGRRRYMKYRKYKKSYRRRKVATPKTMFPKTRLAKVVHQGNTTPTLSSLGLIGTSNYCIVKANDPFDPLELSLVGAFNKTAAGQNFWGNFYDHYEVVESKFTMIVKQSMGIDSGQLLNQMKIGLRLGDDATKPLSTELWTNYIADPNVKMKTLRFNTDGSAQVKLSMKFNAKKFFARIDNAAHPGATTNSSPTELAYFIPFWQVENLSTTETINSNINISFWTTYTVKYAEPKSITTMPYNQGFQQ